MEGNKMDGSAETASPTAAPSFLCQLYGGGICPFPATVNLRAPDGEVLWCPYCETHAAEHVREYKEKLGEEWVIVPISGASGAKPGEAIAEPEKETRNPEVTRPTEPEGGRT